MKLTTLFLALVLGACASTGVDAPRGPVNATCPRSGEPVAADSLTEYRGFVVGFCNTHCRDDFAAHVAERPKDTEFFDRVIAEQGLDR